MLVQKHRLMALGCPSTRESASVKASAAEGHCKTQSYITNVISSKVSGEAIWASDVLVSIISFTFVTCVPATRCPSRFYMF